MCLYQLIFFSDENAVPNYHYSLTCLCDKDVNNCQQYGGNARISTDVSRVRCGIILDTTKLKFDLGSNMLSINTKLVYDLEKDRFKTGTFNDFCSFKISPRLYVYQ